MQRCRKAVFYSDRHINPNTGYTENSPVWHFSESWITFASMKVIYTVLGSISLALGIAGVFLPLLPTTPFMLLTAWLYCKSSPRLYGWLMSHPYLGPYIRNYRDRRAITLSGKILSVALVWITILFCIVFVVDPLWLKIGLAAIPIGVTWHILSFRTLRRDENLRFVRVRNAGHLQRLLEVSGDDPACGRFPVSKGSISAGNEFYLISAAGRDKGYIWLRKDYDNPITLHSLYIIPQERGGGCACEAMAFLEHCRSYRNMASMKPTSGKAGKGVRECKEDKPTESASESKVLESDASAVPVTVEMKSIPSGKSRAD